MANYANLKSDIAGVIRTNNNEEITGDILQEQLLGMVDSLGAGFQYKGVATPTTAPGTPDENVFYIASTAGTYTNFGGLVVAEGEVAILKYNGSWAKDVTGAATAAQVTQLGQQVIYDVTKNNPTAGPNNDGKFESLSALLSDANLSTLIPVAVRCGGMSIRFVQSSDNKYVQYRLMLSTFTATQFTNVANWQGVDDEPTAGSDNLVKSGGVFSSLYITLDLAEDTTWTDGYAINATNGYGHAVEGCAYCDFVDVSGYEKIVVKGFQSSKYGGAFYREANSGAYIEGFGYGSQISHYSDIEVDVPANAKYCRLTKSLSESSDNKQGVYVDVSTIDKAVGESEERVNLRVDGIKSELDAKDAELSSEIDSINTQLEGLYVEKPLGVYGISIGTLKSGEAINVLIQDTTAQYVTLIYNGSSVSSFYKGIPSTYINTSGSEQALSLSTNPNDVIKAIVQRPQQENADNAFCIPRSISLPASGNMYTGHTFYLKRGVKYSLEINDWVSHSTNQTTFEIVLDGVTLMNLPVKKICLKPDLSGVSDFARLTIGGRLAEGHNATIILSNDDIEEQEAEITGLGGTNVFYNFGVNEGKIYYVDVKKWVSNDNETAAHFAISLHKKDGTAETPILKTTKVADYSGLYEIDTSNVLVITVSGRIKEGLTSVVKVYEKEKFSDIKIDVQGNGSTYVQGSAEIWPGVYKATVSDWNAATSDGTSFYIYLKDVDNNTLAIKNVMKVARNFDGDYMITVPDNYCEIHFDGRIINGMTAHIEMEKLESARDFPAIRCNLDFPVLGCGRYSVQAPNCTYAHGGIVIFNEKYIFVQFLCSDAFYGENYYGTAGLSVIDKYSRSIRHIDVFSPRAIYLNGQLLEHTHIAMMVALNDYTVRICGTVKVNDVCTIINRTYNAEDNVLSDNIVCNLKYNGNTVTYDINNFIEMCNSLYSLDLTPDANKHAVDLPRLCKYNGEYYGAFNVDECAVGMNANTFVIMKSADGITWEPVNCVTGDYQVTETGITFCDNKFFVIGRSESGHFCWYCVTDINGNVIKPMTLIPNSIHSMPTITTSRNKVYVMYNVTPNSGSHYSRTKCCFAEIGTTVNYELTVLTTYVDNNGINYFNMATKPNGVILMSYITDPESYISNDNPTSDICLAEINI